MLTFKLISNKNGTLHYEIYPENDESRKGHIIFNPSEKKLIERVDPDSPFNCISHFLNSYKDIKGNFRKEGMVAWYKTSNIR